jgi:predicted small secreted protein
MSGRPTMAGRLTGSGKPGRKKELRRYNVKGTVIATTTYSHKTKKEDSRVYTYPKEKYPTAFPITAESKEDAVKQFKEYAEAGMNMDGYDIHMEVTGFEDLFVQDFADTKPVATMDVKMKAVSYPKYDFIPSDDKL